jgi:integrase
MGRYDAKANQGERTLSDDELRTIWKATEPSEKEPQPFYALIRFLLLTGARRNEANRLPWAEIVGTDWALPAARNKVKTDLTRPLSKAVIATLDSVPRIDGGALVFSLDGRRPLSLTRPHNRLMKESGVANWTLHDLRRTARTLLARAGIPDAHAEQCLGHVLPGAVAQIYNKHQYRKEMAQAYEALASQVERIVNPPANVVTPLRRKR